MPLPQPQQPTFQQPQQPTFGTPSPAAPAPQRQGILQRGSLVLFHYQFWKHDPYPVVIVSKVENGYMLKGVNLHYLTFQYVKRLLTPNVNNPAFSYYNIKQDQYIVDAFRSYSWRGIDFGSMRVLDGKFLVQMMQVLRSFDPLQVRAIRQEIERQLAQTVPQMQAPAPGAVEQPATNIQA